MAHQLMSKNSAHVVEDKAVVSMFQHRSMTTHQDVEQVHGAVVTHSGHIRIEPRSPGAVAHAPHELDNGLTFRCLIQPPHPIGTANSLQVTNQPVHSKLRT